MIGIGLIAAVAFGAWLLAGVWIIQEPEQGVVLRFGKYHRTIDPGFNWAPYFIDKVESVNVQEIRIAQIGFRTQGGAVTSVPHEALMLTQDENIVNLQFAVQYRVRDPAAFLFNVSEPELTLRQGTESAVREIVGRSGMDFVLTAGREAVAAEVGILTQEILDLYTAGLHVTSVNMQDAQPPDPVQEAFLDAIKAREDQERIINEATAYKADVVPKARGEATAIIQRAEAYRQRVVAQAEGETARFLNVLNEYREAPDVTRQRLYIETMEAVMASSSKVLVDISGGNSLIYLPVDRLMGARTGSSAASRFDVGDTEPSTRSRVFDDAGRSRGTRTGRTR